MSTGIEAAYPAVFNTDFTSLFGGYFKTLNGNCGNGYTSDYKSPNSNQCVGHYAYDDATCDQGCIVYEGIYWAVMTNLGGFHFEDYSTLFAEEWVLTTPDKGMTVPTLSGSSNVGTLEEKAPLLYAAVNNYADYKWLPKVIPDGVYDNASWNNRLVDVDPTAGSELTDPNDGFVSTTMPDPNFYDPS